MRWIARFFVLTRREYYLDFFITPPLTLLMAWHSLHSSGMSVAWLLQVTLGWVAWTLYEYLLHRFGLHRLPLLRAIHALHHRDPSAYVAQPPWLTLATYVALYLVLGARSSALMVGFSLGYVAYAALHTAFHYVNLRPGTELWRLEQRHDRHHRESGSCYGISVDWWDRLLGTERA